MSAVDIIQRGDDLLVSSETIAEGTENQHKNVLQLIRTYRDDLAEFGRVESQTRPFETAGGTQYREIFLLNEPQATLILTYMRNMDRIREFKKALVRAFFDMARRLTACVPDITTPEGVLALAQTLTRTAEELVAARNTVAVLEPRAEAWDEIASANGDLSVADASKMLVRAGVETGPQRLFEQLAGIRWIFRGRDGKWRAYASAVSEGYLTERPQSHPHPRTGERVLDAPQVRVTMRGVERLRVRLGTLTPELTQ